MSDDVKALFRQKLASSQSKSLEALKAAKRAKLQKQARADAQQDAALQRKLAEKQRRDAAARAVQAQAEASRPSVRYVAPPEGRDHSQPAQQPATGRISDAKRARLAKVEKYKRPLTTAASKDSASKQEPAASSRQARDAAPNKGSTAEKGSVPAGFFDDSVQDAKVRKAPLPHETKAAEWAEFEKEIEKEAETTEAIIEADTNQTTIQRTLFELEEQKQLDKRVDKLRELKEQAQTKAVATAAAKAAAKADGSDDDGDDDDDDEDWDEELQWRSRAI